MQIINFTVCNGDFIDWYSELKYLQNKFHHFYVQTGSYVPNIKKWMQNNSFETKFIPFLDEGTMPREGRLYILISVKYIEKKRNEILSYKNFKVTLYKENIKMLSTDIKNYIYTNNGLIIDIHTLNLIYQDCELVCGRDFFYI